MRLVLFEIDETLVWLQGAGLAATVRALREVYGVTANTMRYSIDGKTEPQIARHLLRRSGIGPEIVAAGLDRWMLALPADLRAVLAGYAVEACPGAAELLNALRARDDVCLGLLTGSLESTAPIKLMAANIEPEIFRVGAYGSDDADRKKLPAIAVMRAEEILDRMVLQHEVVVVGATPAELTCARAYGARCVGVATGRATLAELQRHEPDAVFADLRAIDQVLPALLA